VYFSDISTLTITPHIRYMLHLTIANGYETHYCKS